MLSETGEGKVFEEWVGEASVLALRFWRGRRKGSALKNMAEALQTDGLGCTLSVGREVKMEILGNTRRSFLKAPKEAIYESRDRWRRRRRLRLSSLSSHARNCVPSDRDRQDRKSTRLNSSHLG